MRQKNDRARAMCAVFASSCVIAFGAVPARAGEAEWAELARRVAASQPVGRVEVTVGAEPPHFVFPSSARPRLPVLGSTWWPGTAPHVVHIYYAPSSRTDAASNAMLAKLASSGYVRLAKSPSSDAFVGEYGAVQRWCSSGQSGPEIDVRIATVEGRRALDLLLYLSSGPLCRAPGALPELGPEARIPILGNIDGLRIYPGMRTSRAATNFLAAAAIVRTALPAADAVAKLAERFTAKGWSAQPPVANGTAILQRFTRVENARRWNALLLFEGREGSYDAILDVGSESIPPAVR